MAVSIFHHRLCRATLVLIAASAAMAVNAASAQVAAPRLPVEDCRLQAGTTLPIRAVQNSENVILEDGQEFHLGVLTAGLDDIPAKRALETLLNNRTITFFRQRGGSARMVDRYRRRQGQAVVTVGNEDIWLQGYLVAQGLARVTPAGPAGDCMRQLLAIEERARLRRMGHWSSAVFQVLDADKPESLSEWTGRFAIVEGVIRRVSRSRGRIYLNFGTSWRNDFTVLVPERLLAGHAGSETGARRTKALEHGPTSLVARNRIRVRGWIEQRGGPLIEIRHLDQIEQLPN